MKNALIALLCLLSLSLASGQKAPKTSNVTGSDQETRARLGTGGCRGRPSVDQYEADEIITTDPTGRVTGKAEDRTDLSSVDYKIQSEELSDLTVNVYGNIAVATATNTMKGRIRGRI
jgi:hypothetical protein